MASRAHHAEIGGIRPGSMPPAARNLAEEGVVIPPTYLVEQGEPRWDAIRELLLDGALPVAQRRGQPGRPARGGRGQPRRGRPRCARSPPTHGAETVLHYMDRLERLADDAHPRGAARDPATGVYAAEERLDDGTPLRVRIDLERRRARIDFDRQRPASTRATSTPRRPSCAAR